MLKYKMVAIGASAGGLEPLRTFFRRIDPGTDLSFVVLQHLAPDHRSLMGELLRRETELEVTDVVDGLVPAPGHIYLPPSDRTATLHNGRFALEPRPAGELQMPIDRFFASMAQPLGPQALAIVLSGTGADGSRGLVEVVRQGGVALVQDPEEAQFDGMPLNALATGEVAFVGTATELAERTAQLSDEEVLGGGDHERLDRVLEQLKALGGFDFTGYRSGPLHRRLVGRMAKLKVELEDYLILLRQDANEVQELTQTLLLGVTAFLRDPDSWDELAERVLRPLVSESGSKELRFWVAACSTGQEAYSLAVLVQEELERVSSQLPFRIFATDVNRRSLKAAGRGVYTTRELEPLGETRRDRWFSSLDGNQWQVDPTVRRNIVFAHQDLVRDAAFTRMNVTLCRNALIYMAPHLQRDVVAALDQSLPIGGVMMLGPAESLGPFEKSYSPVSRSLGLFEKTQRSSPPRARLDRRIQLDSRPAVRVHAVSEVPESLLEAAVEGVLAEERCACLVIDVEGNVLHVLGELEPFARPVQGRLDRSYKTFLREELHLPVGSALHRVTRVGETTRYRALEVDGARCDLTVRSVPEGAVRPQQAVLQLRWHSELPVVETVVEDTHAEVLKRLEMAEAELEATRENLQAAIEELETANEEQQSTNEELLASNEELQSTNEELQSVNEELYTVNAEYQRTIRDLTSLNADTENLMSATDVGTIFVGDDGAIRRFTPAATQHLPLTEADIGRPLGHLAHDLRKARALRFEPASEQAAIPSEEEIEVASGSVLLVRRQPFLRERVRDGFVITIVDVTSVKQREAEVSRLGTIMQALMDHSPLALSLLNEELRYTQLSQAASVLLGLDQPVQALGRTIAEVAGDWAQAHQEIQTRVCASGENDVREAEFPNGLRAVVSHFPIDLPDGRRLVGSSALDVTELREAQRAANRQAEMLSAVFRAAPVAMLVMDSQGTIVQSNQEAGRLGLSSGGDWRMLAGSDEWTSDGRDRREESVLQQILSGTLDASRATQELRPSGADRAATVVVQMQAFGSGPDRQVLVVGADISQEYEAQRRLERRNAELETLRRELTARNEELGEFNAVVSHDLKEPLRTISSYGDLLAERVAAGGSVQEDEEIERLLGRLLEAANRAGRMVTDFVEYSRAGSVTTDGPSDPRAAAEAAVASLAASIAEKHASVEIGELPRSAAIDQGLLESILSNAVSNSLRFCEGPPAVVVHGLEQDERVLLTVEDNGIGVPQDALERIFEPFHRIHPRSRYEGTGIGLAICRRIVESHGGRIRAEAAEGDGATTGLRVLIELPSAEDP